VLSTGARRYVYDCSYGDGTCYVDFYSAIWDYYFGRSEGKPERGLNPKITTLIQTYPQETDRLYYFLGTTYNYFLSTFGRDGANGFGGLSDGTDYPLDIIRAVSYADYKLPSLNCPNAMFNPMLSGLEFCGGLMLADTVGHEFAHAVIYHSVNSPLF